MSAAVSIEPRPEDPAAALAALRADRAALDDAEVRRYLHTLDFVSMHLVAAGEGATQFEFGSDTGLPLAGAGAPEVGEFAVIEYSAALGMSTDAGRRHVGAVMEVRYRLRHLHALVVAGELPVWRARRIAEHTLSLPEAGAAFVDRRLAPAAVTSSWAQIERLCEEARVRFDPETAAERRRRAADGRRFDVDTDQVSYDGTVEVSGTLDLADGLDLDAAVSAGAAELGDLGCEESLDVRRSMAAGELGRRQRSIEFGGTEFGGRAGEDAPRPRANDGAPRPQDEDEAPRPRSDDATNLFVRPRELVLHLHVSATARTGGSTEIGRCGNTRSPISVEQVRQWVGDPGARVVVKPVIDLNEEIHATSYEIPDRLREQVGLRDVTCVFPGCTRPAERCDRDHIMPYDESGETSTSNLACLCRRHHRAKTHGGFRYRRIGPGAYEWTTPHGYRIVRDHRGTHPVTDP